jgi:hypothetical protein
LSKVNEEEAARTYQLLAQMKQLGELDVPDVDPFETTPPTSDGRPERGLATPLNYSDITSRDSSTPLRSAQNDSSTV